jgi:hypothetical protein
MLRIFMPLPGRSETAQGLWLDGDFSGNCSSLALFSGCEINLIQLVNHSLLTMTCDK